eukprot:g12194.t1
MRRRSALKLHPCTLHQLVSTSSEGKRPVLVFIHGGFLISGSVADYYGKLNYMANQANAVVVAIQYRLNLFGFLQPPADIESIPANRGLRDQIESLKWVQKNIASFGGDAESATFRLCFRLTSLWSKRPLDIAAWRRRSAPA